MRKTKGRETGVFDAIGAGWRIGHACAAMTGLCAALTD